LPVPLCTFWVGVLPHSLVRSVDGSVGERMWVVGRSFGVDFWRQERWAFAVVGLWCWSVGPGVSGEEVGVEFFERKIRPVLVERCYDCHSAGADKLRGGLQVDHLEHLLRGGESGAAVVVGDVGAGLLLASLRYDNPDLQMPPKSKLDDGVIGDFEKWIAAGAPWPEEGVPERELGVVRVDGSDAVMAPFDLGARVAEHWSWQPVERPWLPGVERGGWARDELDLFIQAGVEGAGLVLADDAAAEAWLRRVSYDLTGLPPSAGEVERFLAAKASDPGGRGAEEAVVDALLASPHYGERWARHWMDLARYAESCGHEFDYPIPHAFRYRDYLIEAFRTDVPYDQFLIEHLAGDLLGESARQAEDGSDASVVATGFWFFHEAVHAPTDVRLDESERVDNQIDVFAKSFLGLTVSCARCHDHKFDAISAADYYSLAGVLRSVRRQEVLLDPGGLLGAAAGRARDLAAEGDLLLAGAFGVVAGEEGVAGEKLASYLLAGQRVLGGGGVEEGGLVERVAGEQGLDAALLARWAEVLAGGETGERWHPLRAWRELVEAGGEGLERLAKEYRDIARDFVGARERGEVAADFRGGDPAGWTGTGLAFGEGPATGLRWAPGAGGNLVVPAEAFSTAGMPEGFAGVVRSPTFELGHEQVHLRLMAKGVTVRIVIDGYHMHHYNGLLFGGTIQRDVDTGGRFEWVTMRGSLDKYRGHRAWIELQVDEGGHLVLDEVIVSAHGMRSSPGVVGWEVLGIEGEVVGLVREELAGRYGRLFAAGLSGLRGGELGAGELEWINFLWREGLWEREGRLVALEAAHRGMEVPLAGRAQALLEGTPYDERVYVRGSHRVLGEEVKRRNLEAFGGQQLPREGSGRLELAQLLVAEDNPLVRRVIVNRLWHHLFGRGLVASVDDFGVMGQAPSHPELLDYLAVEFGEGGWSIKGMLRRLVLSRAYGMASEAHPDNDLARLAEIDPENVLLHRAPLRRLQAEAIRDGILAVSGRLDASVGGPSVPVHLTSFMGGRGRPGSSGPLDGDGRRSLYLAVSRNFLSPFLLAFDKPGPFNAMGRRSLSNVPAQALALMNDPFVLGQARGWAERMVAQEGWDDEERIQQLFLSAYARRATAAELGQILDFLGRAGGSRQEAWSELCHVLINKKEFIYLR